MDHFRRINGYVRGVVNNADHSTNRGQPAPRDQAREDDLDNLSRIAHDSASGSSGDEQIFDRGQPEGRYANWSTNLPAQSFSHGFPTGPSPVHGQAQDYETQEPGSSSYYSSSANLTLDRSFGDSDSDSESTTSTSIASDYTTTDGEQSVFYRTDAASVQGPLESANITASDMDPFQYLDPETVASMPRNPGVPATHDRTNYPSQPSQVLDNSNAMPRLRRSSTGHSARSRRRLRRRSSQRGTASFQPSARQIPITLAAGKGLTQRALATECRKEEPSSKKVRSFLNPWFTGTHSYYKEATLACITRASRKHNRCLRLLIQSMSGGNRARFLNRIKDTSRNHLLTVLLSPLERSAFDNYHLEVMEMLLNNGIDANKPAVGTHRTPLHQVVDLGIPEAVELLIRHGVDPGIKDGLGGDGKTARELASYHLTFLPHDASSSLRRDRQRILELLS